jgi:hypothetical protein
MKLVNGGDKEVVWLREHKLFWQTLIDEDPVDTRGSEVPEGVVLPSQTVGEHRVHEHVGHRVGQGGDAVTEAFIDSPNLQSFGNLLVLIQGVFIVRCVPVSNL